MGRCTHFLSMQWRIASEVGRRKSESDDGWCIHTRKVVAPRGRMRKTTYERTRIQAEVVSRGG